MNKLILIGNLVADPEFQEVSKDTAVCKFRIAVNYGKEKSLFIDCNAWNGVGKNIYEFLKKGNKCMVEGELEIGSYENKDKEIRYYTRMNVFNCEFLTSPYNKEEDEKPAKKGYSRGR